MFQKAVLVSLWFMAALLDMSSVTQTVTLGSHADDTKVVQADKELSDANLLLKYFEVLRKWAEDKMQFNEGKQLSN